MKKLILTIIITVFVSNYSSAVELNNSLTTTTYQGTRTFEKFNMSEDMTTIFKNEGENLIGEINAVVYGYKDKAKIKIIKKENITFNKTHHQEIFFEYSRNDGKGDGKVEMVSSDGWKTFYFARTTRAYWN